MNGHVDKVDHKYRDQDPREVIRKNGKLPRLNDDRFLRLTHFQQAN